MAAQLLVNSELLSANSVAMMLYHGTDFAARDEARFCCKHTKANLYCICRAEYGLQTGSVQACGSCPPLGETTPPAVDTAGISPRRNGRRRARTPKRMTRADRPSAVGVTRRRVQVVAPRPWWVRHERAGVRDGRFTRETRDGGTHSID
jgi:hypothetical protein